MYGVIRKFGLMGKGTMLPGTTGEMPRWGGMGTGRWACASAGRSTQAARPSRATAPNRLRELTMTSLHFIAPPAAAAPAAGRADGRPEGLEIPAPPAPRLR